MAEKLDKLSFEEALKRLEQVVQELEKGELSLERALELFAEGVALARLCDGRLNEAEAKIEKLLGDAGAVPFEA